MISVGSYGCKDSTHYIVACVLTVRLHTESFFTPKDFIFSFLFLPVIASILLL